MSAPSKFLFDVDFTRGPERQATVPLAEHATKLAEAETAAHRRGYAEGKAEAAAEAERRIAAAASPLQARRSRQSRRGSNAKPSRWQWRRRENSRRP